jgi:hypothetical protein
VISVGAAGRHNKNYIFIKKLLWNVDDYAMLMWILSLLTEPAAECDLGLDDLFKTDRKPSDATNVQRPGAIKRLPPIWSPKTTNKMQHT